MPSTVVTKIDEKLHKAARVAAAERDVTLSTLVSDAIREYLDRTAERRGAHEGEGGEK